MSVAAPIEDRAYKPLSAREIEWGWVEYHCDAHGFLAASASDKTVWCRCGKRCRVLRAGRVLDPDSLKPTAAKARELNLTGHPFIHGCGDCGEDFGGKTLRDRHRVGRGSKRRCLTSAEMTSKGYRVDTRGRWHLPAPRGITNAIPLTDGNPERAVLSASGA